MNRFVNNKESTIIQAPKDELEMVEGGRVLVWVDNNIGVKRETPLENGKDTYLITRTTIDQGKEKQKTYLEIALECSEQESSLPIIINSVDFGTLGQKLFHNLQITTVSTKDQRSVTVLNKPRDVPKQRDKVC